jgi:hypothetical protein
MKISMNRSGFVLLILISLAFFATCQFTRQSDTADNSTQAADTIFLSQWRREKAEKIKLIASYEARLSNLQEANDSLSKVVVQKKQTLAAYRFKEKFLQERLKEQVGRKDTSRFSAVVQDSIPQLVDSLVFTSQQSDTACDQTIRELENQVANRDSTIFLHRNVEDNLREVQKRQELSNQYLTEQLNTAFKNQRKRSRQNKLLAGGLLILSGITTSILLTHSLK